MQKSKVKLTPTLLEHLRDAVQKMEESWDAQRDFELEAGQDFDGMGDFVSDYAVMGYESVDMQTLKDFLEANETEFEE